MPELNTPAKEKSNGKRIIIGIIILQIAVIIHSFSGVFAKFASGNDFWSWEYWIPYGASLVCTLIYALLWQQVLKRVPLSTAFLCKSTGTVWVVVLGCLIFKEVLTVGKIIGLVLVVVGSLIVVDKNE